MKKCYFPANGAKPIAPYSPGVEANGFLFISGQIGKDPATGLLGPDIASQTRQTFLNIKAILDAAGLTFDDVVKVTVFLTDIRDFAGMNKVYAEFFNGDCPARSAFQIAALPGEGALLEVELIVAR